jgi:hypothetical protein
MATAKFYLTTEETHSKKIPSLQEGMPKVLGNPTPRSWTILSENNYTFHAYNPYTKSLCRGFILEIKGKVSRNLLLDQGTYIARPEGLWYLGIGARLRYIPNSIIIEGIILGYEGESKPIDKSLFQVGTKIFTVKEKKIVQVAGSTKIRRRIEDRIRKMEGSELSKLPQLLKLAETLNVSVEA